ncbi:MAG: S41 family peptidase [Chitinophagaceae bacterium]|nr:S41 family peptidase [Chitinophagaceae bacterium]
MQHKSRMSLMPVVFALLFLVGLAMGYALNNKAGGGSIFSKNKNTTLQEISNLIQAKYVDPIAVDSLNEYAIEEMLRHIDPHSVYIPPIDLQAVNNEMEGQFVGIGIIYDVIDDTVTVINVLKNGPALKAGILVGDKILKANDTINLVNKNQQAKEIRNYLRGKEGSSVKIYLKRNQQFKEVNITRASIPIPSIDVAYKLDSVTGYIKINKFAERTYEEFMQSLEALQKQKMDKLIIDLRENGGGYMSAATAIADELLAGDKLIVYTQGNKSERAVFQCKKEGLFEKGELIVLIDENSASASEVLTGALQDWDRATIVGRRSFGKGLVQQQFNLSNGGAIRLTVARYYTPLGRNIQKPYTNGVEAYKEEVLHRFIDGELSNQESKSLVGKPVYKTPKGKLVYGGGGIIPDYFIPIDTILMDTSKSNYKLMMGFNKFIYQYFFSHQIELKKYTNYKTFYQTFKLTQEDWRAIEINANKHKGSEIYLSPELKVVLEQKLKEHLIKLLFSTEEYYKYKNLNDAFIKKATMLND